MSRLTDFDLALQRTTVGATVRSQPEPDKLTQISDTFARLRDDTRFLANDAAKAHDTALKLLLAKRTEDKIRMGGEKLLVELSDVRGLGWSDIARLVGVSVPAVRKWRLGGDMKPDRLHDLARLCAFLELISDREISDPGTWIQTPLSFDLANGLTKAEVYSSGHALDLLAYADNHIGLEQLLMKVQALPDAGPSDVEFVSNSDGSKTIVPTEDSNSR